MRANKPTAQPHTARGASRREVKVLLPASFDRAALGRLPRRARTITGEQSDTEVLVLGAELADKSHLFTKLPQLRLIQALSSGVDWFIADAPDHVTVCNGSGIHDVSVAEWVLTVLLALQRRIPDFLDLQRRGAWDPDVNDFTSRRQSPLGPIEDLSGKSVLIVGYGSIGRSVASRLRPFGVRIVCVARRARPGVDDPSALPKHLPNADIVILLVPLSPSTERIVDSRFLARMKPGALLINASRGGLVDTDALVTALRERRVRAALDVTDPEPLPHDHPLWTAPGVLITPHVAGAVSCWQPRAYRFAGQQIRRYLYGRALLNTLERTMTTGH